MTGAGIKRLLALALVMLLTACAGGGDGGYAYHNLIGRGMAKTDPDPDPVRRIVMEYPYNHEKLDVVYYHDGHYDRRAMHEIDVLFRDRHADVVGRIDPALIDYMVDIRKRLDLPATVVFQILSGYRTPATNAMLAQTNGNVAKESLHMRGWAVDFRIADVSGAAIAAVALTMQRGGVAYYHEDNHVHIDIGNIRTWHLAGNQG
ncbi:MAG: DUF882 domain-containing protein [Alphaproteobacteria bacterium]|nr:DUF882 domain-containing protein [Alphaproteobacteria bacterium]